MQESKNTTLEMMVKYPAIDFDVLQNESWHFIESSRITLTKKLL